MDLQTVQKNIDEVAREFGRDWKGRQRRRGLETQDFDDLRSAGFHLTGVPESHGGVWTELPEATRSICHMLRTLARSDSSLSLVASMHPSMMGIWTALPEVAPEFQTSWSKQREYVFDSALKGCWWGTITSEPGTNGDLMLTKSMASPTDQSMKYLIDGTKHFGSGSGLARRMVTTAVPQGESQPDLFIAEMPEMPWEGKEGVQLLAAWDGHGMTATQSHSLKFISLDAERVAWPGQITKLLGSQRGAISCMFTAVIVGIIDAAVQEAKEKLKPSRKSMGAYEQIEWTRALKDQWLLNQAFQGMLAAMEDVASSARQTQFGKMAIAELADEIMLRIVRVVGGGAFSRSSPFSYWQQDVRALGYLRPPWALSYERAFDAITAT